MRRCYSHPREKTFKKYINFDTYFFILQTQEWSGGIFGKLQSKQNI